MTEAKSAENMLYSTMRFLAKKANRQKKIRFGEFLVRAGVVTEEQLEQALAEQQKSGSKIGEALVELGIMSPRKLHKCLARHFHVEFVDLSRTDLKDQTIHLLKEAQARRHRAIVLESDKDGLLIGMANPGDIHAYDELSRLLKKTLRVALVNESDLLSTIDARYRRKEEIDALAAEVKRDLGDGEIDIDELSAGADISNRRNTCCASASVLMACCRNTLSMAVAFQAPSSPG
jgi:MSHA biogenesis protein MshE